MSQRIIQVSLLFALLFSTGSQRVQAQAKLEFDVVSIKPNNSGSGLMAYGCHGTDTTRPNGQVIFNIQFGPPAGNQPTVIPAPLGQCSATNAPLKVLIAYAYDLNTGPDQIDQRVLSGSSWVGTARFDLQAKAEKPMREADMRAMLQAMLADQFKLQVHRDTKESSGYVLVVAKGGAKIKPSPDDTNGAAGPGAMRGGMMAANDGGRMTLNFRKMPIANFVTFLSGRLNKTVVDQTDLKGNYDFALTYTPEGEAGLLGGGGGGRGGAEDPAPSLFTAVQEQLGLRLEAQKVATETIVIDRAERPPQN